MIEINVVNVISEYIIKVFTINRDFWKDALTYYQFYIYTGLLDFGEISWETLTPKAVSVHV